MKHPCKLLLVALVVTAAIQHAKAQFGMPGMGMEQPKAAAVKSDIPYIRCQTCESIIKQAYRHIKGMRAELKPGQKLEESNIIEYLEKMCDPSKPEGQWISHYDIVEQGDELKLVDTGKAGKCNTECMTIARACSQITEDLDLSDLSEALYLGKSRSSLSNEACYETTGVCRKKPPPVPKDRKPGPAHEPFSAEEAERERLMSSMKAAGLGGQMYSRDDMMSQLDGLQEEADEGDIPKTQLHEAAGAAGEAGTEAEAAGGVAAKAQEAVQEVVGQAKEAAAAAVDKASSFLKGQFSKLSSSFKGDSKAAEEAEL